MRKKIQYSNEAERQLIIEEHQNLILIEEHNVFDGNFLVFTDEVPKPTVVYLQVNADEMNQIKTDNEMLKLMVADLGLMVGGGL